MATIHPATGGYDYDFVDRPQKSLECPICLLTLRDPHVVSCCGNEFCQVCIEKVQSSGRPCPLCSEQNFTTLLHKKLVREVNLLSVRCPHKDIGCEWIGELRQVEKHVNAGSSSDGCGYERVDCDYQCGARVQRRMIDDHKRHDCPKHPITSQIASLMQKVDGLSTECTALRQEVKSVKEENQTLRLEIQQVREELRAKVGKKENKPVLGEVTFMKKSKFGLGSTMSDPRPSLRAKVGKKENKPVLGVVPFMKKSKFGLGSTMSDPRPSPFGTFKQPSALTTENGPFSNFSPTFSFAGQPTTNKADGVVNPPPFDFSKQPSAVTTESGPFAKSDVVLLFSFNAGQPTTKADGVVKSPSFNFSTQLSPVTTESGPFAKGGTVQPFLFKPLPGAQAAKPSPQALHSQPVFSLGLPKKEVATNQSNTSPAERSSQFWNQGPSQKPVFQLGTSSPKEPLTGANRTADSCVQSPFQTSMGNPRPVANHQGVSLVPSTSAAVPVFSEKKEPSPCVKFSKLIPDTSAQGVGPGKLSTGLASGDSTYPPADSQFLFQPQKSLGFQSVSAKDLGGGLVQAVAPIATVHVTTANATQTPKYYF